MSTSHLIPTTSKRNVQLYVPDPKHGYAGDPDGDDDERPLKEKVVEAYKQMKVEIKMWRDEWIERLKNDPILLYFPGEFPKGGNGLRDG